MIRKLIKINEEKCTGCGLCADACHEGAIGIVNGKAKLLREDYCDGLGDCLPACPTDAISFEEREAPAYDEAAVLASKKAKEAQQTCSCSAPERDGCAGGEGCSMLANFPVQLKLVPVNSPCFEGADLLIAADCTAYACGDFHRRFMRGRVTLIGCPKLDGADYSEKMQRIFEGNDIGSITLAIMTVPCCGGLAFAVKKALEMCKKDIPVNIVTISPDGRIIKQGE